MNQASQPQYRRWVIVVTLLVIVAVFMGFALYGISHPRSNHYKYLIPLAAGIWIIGAKFAAPAIPFIQVLMAGVIIILIHIGAELTHWPPALLLAEIVIDGFCIYGFGAHWVRKGYIPKFANH